MSHPTAAAVTVLSLVDRIAARTYLRRADDHSPSSPAATVVPGTTPDHERARDMASMHATYRATDGQWSGVGDSPRTRRLRGALARLMFPYNERIEEFLSCSVRMHARHDIGEAELLARVARLEHELAGVRAREAMNVASEPAPDEYVHVPPLRARDLELEIAGFFASGPVVDLRCDRGDLMAQLELAGITAIGIDDRPDAVRCCQRRGLTSYYTTWQEYCSGLHPGSLGGVIMAGLLEHETPARRQLLLSAVLEAAAAGSTVVVGIGDGHDPRSIFLEGQSLSCTAVAAALEWMGFCDVHERTDLADGDGRWVIARVPS